MRVLHVFDHSLPHQSGYTYRSLNILRSQQNVGMETWMLTGPRQGSGAAVVETFDGMNFFRTPDPRPIGGGVALEYQRYRALRQRAAEVIRCLRPDIVHVHSPVLNALPVGSLCRRLGIPWVYEVRATWEDAAVSHGTMQFGDTRYRVSQWLETRMFRRADHIFPICDGLAGEISGRGVPAAKISVVRNLVEVPGTAASAGQSDAPASGPEDAGSEVRLGYIGSFYKYEGIDLLLDLAARPWAARNRVRIYLIGGGPQAEALRSEAERRDLGDRVVFVGKVPNNHVAEWYRFFDALVLPRRSERLTELVTPLKPLEAMAHRCTVVASRIGGHQELIRDRETGYLFAPGDVADMEQALATALAERPDWPAMHQRAIDHIAKHHSLAAAGATYRQVFDRLVTGGRRSDVRHGGQAQQSPMPH